MYLFKMKIAEHIAQVETLHIRSQAICAPFFADGLPEFCVRMTQDDIDRKRKQYEAENGECTLWDGALEIIALHEKLSEKLIDCGVLMMHGAAVACHGCSFIFSAGSGTGKSTHVLKWLKNVPNTIVVNGDKPFISFPPSGGQPMACGSPWAGKENMYTNTIVPLKAIILMERAEENHMERVNFAEAFPFLLQQTYRPNNEGKMRKTLSLMQQLNSNVSFWRFKCNNFKDDCFDVAYSALMKDRK